MTIDIAIYYVRNVLVKVGQAGYSQMIESYDIKSTVDSEISCIGDSNTAGGFRP